jgi:hypothetical protein
LGTFKNVRVRVYDGYKGAVITFIRVVRWINEELDYFNNDVRISVRARIAASGR